MNKACTCTLSSSFTPFLTDSDPLVYCSEPINFSGHRKALTLLRVTLLSLFCFSQTIGPHQQTIISPFPPSFKLCGEENLQI